MEQVNQVNVARKMNRAHPLNKISKLHISRSLRSLGLSFLPFYSIVSYPKVLAGSILIS